MSRQRSRSRGPPAGRVPPNSGYTVRFTGRVRSSRRLRGVHLEFDNSAVEEQTTATRCVSLVARGADDSDDTELSNSDQSRGPSDAPVRRRGSLRGTTPAVPASLEPEREPPGTPTPPAASPTFGGPPPPTPSGPPDFSRLAAAATDTFCLWSSRRHVRREGRGTGWLCSIAANAAKQCGTGNIAGRPDPCHAQQCGA